MLTSHPLRPGRAAAGVLSALCLLAGCAPPTPAGEVVPELRSMLSRVDRAIVEHEYEQAQSQLNELVKITVTAREDGDLDTEQAEPILAAVAGLLSALPQPQRPTDAPDAQPKTGTPDVQPETETRDAQPGTETSGGEPDNGDQSAGSQAENKLEKQREKQAKRREKPGKKKP